MKLDLLTNVIVVDDVVGATRRSLDGLTISTKEQGEKGRDLENPKIMTTEKVWKSIRGGKAQERIEAREE